MLVLGIESTCDETAASVVEDGVKILSNVISSQVDLHKKYGGVFPELACRAHIDMILPVIDEAIKKANVTINDIDLISVAQGPGLLGALLIGLNTTKALSFSTSIPYIGVNHIEAHLYAAMMEGNKNIFPSLGVVISGGHTMLLKINSIGSYEKIGTTIDDAIGECFDKVANILDLSYPGGPEVEKLAKDGDLSKYNFNVGRDKNSKFNFSFSGLKTKILYTVKGNRAKKNFPTLIKEEEKKHIAASFQNTVFEDLISKASLACKTFNLKAIYFGGGVSNSKTLRALVQNKNLNIPIYFPNFGLSLDNAAMIAGLGYHKYTEKKSSDPLDLIAKTSYSKF
ncbi:MAG: tRNA N6-adenosine threonylcarbamoyltransferase [Candidatus Anoxychlamydiales bacterium]|nr:tRNA N6-adenosine threonylcarbamoyltransferase [Candidatus Anoxychlamydiales bacterium]